MKLLDFLHTVITSSTPGWLLVCASGPDGSEWRQYWFGWPDDDVRVVEVMQGLKDEGLNVFYSAHLFNRKDAHKDFVIPTRTMFCDLDEAEPSTAKVKAGMLVLSSDHRHQGYWFLNEYLPADKFEELSQRLSYGIDKADHSGWQLGKLMRVPDTLNWKYNPPQRVRVKSFTNKTIDAVELEVFPTLDKSAPLAIIVEDGWIEEALKVPAGHINAHMFFENNKARIREGLHIHYYAEAPDRSKALWSLMVECFRNGFTRSEVYLIAYHSKNNKFKDLRYGAKEALAKDVLRAEREAFSGPMGIRDRVITARKQANSLADKRAVASELALNQMKNYGRFIHCRGGNLYYVLSESGRPIPITQRATELNVLLDAMFGLNAADGEHPFVVNALINYTAGLPATGEVAALSYYLPHRESADKEPEVLLHTGSRDIIRITPTTIDTVVNGYNDVVFLWNDAPVNPDLNAPYDEQDTWYHALYHLSLENLSEEGPSYEQALALLRSWFIMVLLRNELYSRPLLALFGQKGSGKSTLFRKVYGLIYGKFKSVGSLGTQEQFDYAMSSDPVHVLDNLDTWERWLPDRLARAAGISEITRRKLYTDLDVVSLRLQAILGITAHAPKFGREDVVDRLLMLTFDRVSEAKRVDETPMINEIIDKRGKYWAQIAHDVQRVLQQPTPTKVAAFRVMDFSKIGQWIADALGYSEDFYTGIQKIVDQQKGFVLDEDGVLVAAIDSYIKGKYASHEYQTPAKLWSYLDASSGGNEQAFSKQYSNSVKLARKLWAMLDSLQQRFKVEWHYDTLQKTRVWRFFPLDTSPEATNGTEA